MSKKNILLIYSLSAVGIFTALALLSAFYDLQVSDALASLNGGEYFSSNGFAVAVEIFGEIPLYLFLSYAFSVIFWNAYYFGRPIVKYGVGIPCVLAVALVSYFVPVRINEYFAELKITVIDSNALNTFFEVSIALALGVISLVGVMLSSKESIKKQLAFAVVILFTAAVSQLFTQGLKTVNKRVRYRAMNAVGSFELYTPWYKLNGYPESFKRLVDILGTDDAVRSFPSGHTTAAGITYSLIALPFTFKRLEGVKSKAIVYSIAIAYTGTVAIGRIVMGAHYFSDVLFGGSAAFACAAFAVWIIYHKKAVKPLNSYCSLQ